MNSAATQEELQAATNATLRAHATSDEAKALVAKLAAAVDVHAHAAAPLFQKQDVVRTRHTNDRHKMEAVS
jgi:hypothetical protein